MPGGGSGGSIIGGSMRRRSNDGVTGIDWNNVKAEDKTLVYQVHVTA